MEAGEGPVTTEKDLSTVPFIYDARNKVGVLRGPAGDGELVVRLVERHEDDSHTAVISTEEAEGFSFNLREEDVSFSEDGRVILQLPQVELRVDPVYCRKFKSFTRGNYPTPDVAGKTLP